MTRNQKLSRRQFLERSGLVVAGTLGAAGLVGFDQTTTTAWPWPYVALDPQKAAQIAYDGYMNGHN